MATAKMKVTVHGKTSHRSTKSFVGKQKKMFAKGKATARMTQKLNPQTYNSRVNKKKRA